MMMWDHPLRCFFSCMISDAIIHFFLDPIRRKNEFMDIRVRHIR